MNKTLYSNKYQAYVKIPRHLYKLLAKVMDKKQIAEFQINFDNFNQNTNFSVKDIINNMLAYSSLIRSETFLDDLNKYTDKEGNVNWTELLDKYRVENVSIVYN